MKPKPILFSTPMVQAILEGRKTMTRRIVPEKIVDAYYDYDDMALSVGKCEGFSRLYEKDFFGRHAKFQIGDTLWVRETWCRGCEWDGDSDMSPLRYYFRADNDWKGIDWHDEENDCAKAEPKWKPSIFMPFTAARIFLEVTNVRAERLQDISEADAIAEGIEMVEKYPEEAPGVMYYRDYLCKNRFAMGIGFKAKQFFQTLWESINGPESLDENPWVFVYEFKRTEKPIN